MKYSWPGRLCEGRSTEEFFDIYEEDVETREDIDQLCKTCPHVRRCLGAGVSRKETGVWGGIYLQDGKISREFNNHKTDEEWGDLWIAITQSIQPR